MAKKKKDKGLHNYIVPENPQSPRDKELILSEVPRNSRIYVREEGGNLRYKELAKVRDSDTIIYKKDGSPVLMKGRPGRLSEERIKLEAASAEVAEINLQRDEHLADDPLVQAARLNADSPDVLQQTVHRLAEVASSLAFERREAQRKGEPTSMIARREVAALVAVRDASLKRMDQRLKKQEIDLESLAFRNLFVFLVRTFTQSMDAVGIPEQEIDSVISFISKEVDSEEWKNSAVQAIKGVASALH
jgi:hypothetical protein